MTYPAQTLEAAHKHCACHRQEVEASAVCGCFYCCESYPQTEIDEWLEERGGELARRSDASTAFCPRCGIDSVIGDASGYPVGDPAFLRAMHERWFERSYSLREVGLRIRAAQVRDLIQRTLGRLRLGT